jgi:transcriptional regulator with XRE-family HTH domain
MEVFMFFPNRIREARLSKGLSQVELGNRVGVNYGTMSRLENGHIRAVKRVRRRLSRVLRTSESWLFPESSKTPLPNNERED